MSLIWKLRLKEAKCLTQVYKANKPPSKVSDPNSWPHAQCSCTPLSRLSEHWWMPLAYSALLSVGSLLPILMPFSFLCWDVSDLSTTFPSRPNRPLLVVSCVWNHMFVRTQKRDLYRNSRCISAVCNWTFVKLKPISNFLSWPGNPQRRRPLQLCLNHWGEGVPWICMSMTEAVAAEVNFNN